MSRVAICLGAGQAAAIAAAGSLWVLHDMIGGERVAMLAAVAILVLGIPHGSLDRFLVQGPLTATWRSLFRAAAFALTYVTIAGIVAGFWLLLPAYGLTAFLIISAIHFGLGEWSPKCGLLPAARAIAHGCAPIVLIPAFHADEVATLFHLLSDGATAGAVVAGLQTAAWIWLGVTLAYVAAGYRHAERRRRLLELGVLVCLYAAAPPMLGFLVYFGAVHAPRHLRLALGSIDPQGGTRAAAVEVALISLATTAGLATITVLVASDSAQAAIVRTTFIGLAALTVPHMILVDGFAMHRGKRAAR